jgi:hypothetical protein
MISEHDRQILSRLPVWTPAGDIAAQRRAWEELAIIYNEDLPAIWRTSIARPGRYSLSSDQPKTVYGRKQP